METNSDYNNEPMEVYDDLTISNRSKYFLSETARWAKLLSIIGFCSVGLMVIFGLFFGTIFSRVGGFGDPSISVPFPSFLFSLLYIGLAGLYFFPLLYLYRFSTKIKTALQRDDNNVLEDAFENLKSHYKFLGIFMIVMLCIYGLALLMLPIIALIS